jgi:hypothetical protein
MAKRLHMTNADYVAIAISPALIMALVGSLVYFLIEVFYEGQYQARLNYAFGLFVFATVLVARISIEMGSERAVLFALPLAGAMFAFLVRFVEFPSPLSHLLNLLLMTLVWWCAHQLTWDSTVIDDDEDASGEGLMQRIGVDGPAANGADTNAKQPAADGAEDNELFGTDKEGRRQRMSWLKRWFGTRRGPHTPGIWVFYFSLAALPLFGIGQHMIPAGAVGRRRYAFSLLLVYVAAALSLLVTTSFLNLRRYLRQRRVEMPLPIAGTWVGVGAVLILIVMMLAMLIPRPGAEVGLSRVPWQIGSPGGMTASRTSVHQDGGEEQKDQQQAKGGEKEADEGKGNLPPKEDSTGKNSESSSDDKTGKAEAKKDAKSSEGEGSSQQKTSEDEKSSQGAEEKGEKASGKTDERSKTTDQDKVGNSSSGKQQAEQHKSDSESNENKNESREESRQGQTPTSPSRSHAMDAIQNVSRSLGGLMGILKILFYIVAALFVAYHAWKYRYQLMQAIADILRALRELFGGGKASGDAAEKAAEAAKARPPSFTDFRDPFISGGANQMSPDELVRYTFAAFEGWSYDRGRPRTPDCTPQELIMMAVEPKTPMYYAARQLVRLYGEVAYASRRVPREAANELQDMWQLMRSTHSIDAVAAPQI